MPMSFVDRLPLPNFKVYLAGSVLLLSSAVYYAVNTTSDPTWKINATLNRREPLKDDAARDELVHLLLTIKDTDNDTRNFTETFVDVLVFMSQEPLCMWTLINIAYCTLALVAFGVQSIVFGRLRVSESQRLKDKFWNYVFYKFIFVFGVINVQYMDEVLLWCCWFTLVGFLHLFGQLSKDRFEYVFLCQQLSSSPNTSRWAHFRLVALLSGILSASVGLIGVAVKWGLPAGKDTFAFMLAECSLVLLAALHVLARYGLQFYETDSAGQFTYYTNLIFDCVVLVVELCHVVHMVVAHRLAVSMASLVLLLQLRHLLHALHARRATHASHTRATRHMARSYPMASKEEVEKNQDNCAICWEPMKEARKLPCSHLFHNSCLCQWVQQDASCPTCRRALGSPRPARDVTPPPPRPTNHLFRFDGSRYVSWLPSFSVEVTRVRADPVMLDNMARQVQSMFPQYPLSQLAADLMVTRSPALTIDNILAGRLPPIVIPNEAPPPAEVVDAPPAPGPRPPAPAPPPEPTPAATTDPPPAASNQHMPSSTLQYLLENDESIEETDIRPGFSKDSKERETMLERRKHLLVANARRKYVEKLNAAKSKNETHHS